MVFETIKDGLHPPILRVPTILGALCLLAFALYTGTRIPGWMLITIGVPSLLIHFTQRALASYLDSDSISSGRRIGTFLNGNNQLLLSEFLRALAIHRVWEIPLLMTVAAGSIAPETNFMTFLMVWLGFAALMFMEIYILVVTLKITVCFRRDRRV